MPIAKREATPEPAPQVDKLVAQFLALRKRIEEIEDAQKKLLAPFKLTKEKLAGTLLKWLEDTGQEMARTKEGTVSITIKHTASLADPDAFMDYVSTNNAYELMDRKANQVACREYAEEHGHLPPGVKLSSIKSVGVRSPT